VTTALMLTRPNYRAIGRMRPVQADGASSAHIFGGAEQLCAVPL
jgi:hypothetical protein